MVSPLRGLTHMMFRIFQAACICNFIFLDMVNKQYNTIQYNGAGCHRVSGYQREFFRIAPPDAFASSVVNRMTQKYDIKC